MTEPENGLLELLREKKRAAEAGSMDWVEVRDEWIQAVRNLDLRLLVWLRAARDEGLLSVVEREVEVVEEQLGPYLAPALDLCVPSGEVIQVRPKGRLVIGARGRVDVARGSRRISLLREEGGSWVVVQGRSPLSTVPLTRASFEGILEELLQD